MYKEDLVELGHRAIAFFDRYKAKLLQATMSLAFFGFLRISEYADTGTNHSILLQGCWLEENALLIKIPSSITSRTPIKIRVRAVSENSVSSQLNESILVNEA